MSRQNLSERAMLSTWRKKHQSLPSSGFAASIGLLYSLQYGLWSEAPARKTTVEHLKQRQKLPSKPATPSRIPRLAQSPATNRPPMMATAVKTQVRTGQGSRPQTGTARSTNPNYGGNGGGTPPSRPPSRPTPPPPPSLKGGGGGGGGDPGPDPFSSGSSNKITESGIDTVYHDVYLFLDSVRDAADSTAKEEVLRHDIRVLLQGTAQEWYISELDVYPEISKASSPYQRRRNRVRNVLLFGFGILLNRARPKKEALNILQTKPAKRRKALEPRCGCSWRRQKGSKVSDGGYKILKDSDDVNCLQLMMDVFEAGFNCMQGPGELGSEMEDLELMAHLLVERCNRPLDESYRWFGEGNDWSLGLVLSSALDKRYPVVINLVVNSRDFNPTANGKVTRTAFVSTPVSTRNKWRR
ncbi:hypothetical protein QBC44DRAFT_310341 [Cladorrhinum sp. PSN332]|nr:hypothetical protein QBC44DRAFT_310341 [Cladorrhinum sp. PSN332]